MIRILHIADVHLGAPLANFGDYARQRRAEQEAAFRRAVDVALERRVHAVLVAGDLFDTFRPDAETVNLARAELGRLREAGIPVLGVPGTHDSLAWADCVYRKESLPFHHFFTDPSFEEPATLEIGGVPLHVYGIAYDREAGRGWDSLARRAAGGIHVALVHAACRLVPDWPITSDDLPFEEGDLAGLGMDYVALGHYHNLRVFRDERDRVIGAYSGSVEGRDWTEAGPRHVLVVEWDAPAAPPRVTPVPVHTRLLDEREVDVTGVSSLDDVVARVRAVCEPGPLWCVTLVGEPDVLVRPKELAPALSPTLDHVRLRDQTTVSRSHLLADRVEEETVRGEFFRRLVAARERAAGDRDRAVAERALKIGLRVFG